MKLIGLRIRSDRLTDFTKAGNVAALRDWVGRVGFDAAVAHLTKRFGAERAKKIVGKLKGMANRAGTLAPEHSYDPTERPMAKAEAHPGFAGVQAEIARRQGIGKERAGAILAAATRRANAKAKKKNPHLNRVQGDGHTMGPPSTCPACGRKA
jgi:hypothetical protein